MSESNKVLSVSYGTFSCTLEGFDDSVETMKAVASYFRDLAAEDRDFGVDTWEPNPETLARIAEGEYDRRVDATVTDGEIVLTTGVALAEAEEESDETGGNRIANRLRRIRDVAAAGAAVADSSSDEIITRDEEPVTVAVVDTLEEEIAQGSGDLDPEEDISIEDSLEAEQPPEEQFDEDEDEIEEVLWPEKVEEETASEEEDTLEEEDTPDPDEEIEDTSEIEEIAALDSLEGEEVDEDDEVDSASSEEETVAEDAEENIEDDNEEASSQEAEFPVSPLRARIIKLRRSDLAKPEDETAEQNTNAVADDVPSSDNESDALTAQADETDLDDDADDIEDVAGSEDVFVLTNAAQPDAEEEDDDDLESGDEEEIAESEDGSSDEAPSDDDREDAGIAGARFAARLSKRHQFETDVSHDDEDMERILDQTNAQLDEPESRSRRSAIAQLKAAVAATVADREGNDSSAADDNPEDAYREDLSEAVKARGPEASRPAPLKLVPSQRVGSEDDASASSAASKTDAPSFAEFVRTVDAEDLPELLEAAAAHTTFIEGKAQFSRPQIIRKINDLAGADFTREDSLRHFGKLLRDGRIRKASGGQFAVTEDTRYRPDDQDMGVA
ncbi:hypothetical protein AAD018_012550 [Aestuariibius insulae]|uniref:hypothetical protein n=1 Tax=Aestuariibius insulae TaxID=2058287 RepID=UPI00345E3D93